MRLRSITVVVAAAGVALACAVNVAAAVAPPSEPEARVPYVDPFAHVANDQPDATTFDEAAARPAAAPAGPPLQAAAAPSVPAASGTVAPVAQATVVPRTASRPQTVDDWVASAAAATGIPARAVRAYANATLEIAVEDQACHLGWTTIAAIGWIESGHGTHGGATLDDDGRPSVAIVGPVLDGGPGTAAIPATPRSQAWHGDPSWDHAVGPMQFIGSTWARWGSDGDGDGTADPQDVDDAALTTARYLCAGARDLSTWDGWHAAVFSYNHSESYVASVFARATAYSTQARP
ncbi:lytic transglycosylase domain-containing protein [Cellulomonas sp. McL0617]|uniref:lytic transglycosylase domain-containing protein n=1 Tax=Cellulomonas sp. McL0617 TaxID=3415675 RepID=UPI003CF48309